MSKKIIIFIIILAATIFWFYRSPKPPQPTYSPTDDIVSGAFDASRTKSQDEWRKVLTQEQFHILQEAGTEIPYSGALNKENRPGTYYSHGCDVPLFRSEQKYDSGTGWPSFTTPISESSVVLRKENDNRIEVLDPCGGHLGHVFDDGPQPTGKRYCINSVALRFVPDKTATFTIITSGLTRNFSSSMYHNLSPDVYIESASPNLIHIKRANITWSDFFETLPMSLTPTCLTTGTKETFCTSESRSLQFFINGRENPDALDTMIKDGDKLLVTYGIPT